MSIEDTIGTLVRDACSVVPVPKSQYRKRLHRLVLEAQREVLEGLDEPIWELDRDGSGHFNIDDIRAVITERMAAIEAELKEAA